MSRLVLLWIVPAALLLLTEATLLRSSGGGGGGAEEAAEEPEPDRPQKLSDSGFDLKIFWDPTYYWQESHAERKWCVRKDGSTAAIYNCDDDHPTRLTFDFVGAGNDEFRIRVAGGDHCLELTNDSDRDVIFKACSDSDFQLWTFQNGDAHGEGPFEVVPKTLPGHCMCNNDHHPKSGETLYVTSCSSARDSTTSLWEKYKQ